jgi:thiol-disulfide isomerase/thioredoxin
MTLRRLTAAAVAVLALGLPALADDRTAEEILKDLDAVAMPQLDRAKTQDQAYVQKYVQDRQAALEKRGALIVELYKAAPDNDRVPALLKEYFQNSSPLGDSAKQAAEIADAILAGPGGEALKAEAAFVKARNALYAKRFEPDSGAKPAEAIDAFIRVAPADSRGAQLLSMATEVTDDPKEQAALEDRILKDFADTPYAARVEGARRKREAVGKPFELEFADAIKGTTIRMADLKGKVVVVDFWATWCGPCVAEMPNMKKLYAQYKDKGVEFIGVSLDQPKEQGGLDALKKFVAENDIQWPQYYQGNYWQSEFSSKWGINAIPCVFIVDTEGNLHSTEARGKLETLIPELLKGKKAEGAGGGE